MQRRTFIKSALAAGGALACDQAHPLARYAQSPAAPTSDQLKVKRVLAVFKCHFDAGFVDTQANVVQRYFTKFFPEAIRIAAASRQPGAHPYVWTTGSWLLYEYLEQASPEDRKRMEQAIAGGDIAWHALPFSWQTELMDESLISGALALSRALDARFGKRTTGAKMTDVPGHTRAIVSPLAAQGITFLDIGVNGASRPAELPPLFVWQDTRGARLTVMYHHEYGHYTMVPGSDLAIAIVVRGDNSGPHPPSEIANIYADLNQKFPNAQIMATNLAAVADAVEPYRNNLPIVTQELGDTWIYGIASDPLKVARYREVARLRQKWIAAGSLHAGDAADIALLRRMLLEPEHTWGTDTKTWLDFDHYTPADLALMLHTKNYEVVQHSWAEKRQDLFDGVATLPAPLRAEAESSLSSLAAQEPRLNRGRSHPPGKEIDTPHFVLRLDPKTGAIHRLFHKASAREWASADHPLALFSYQTLSRDDYQRFFKNYIISTADWAAKDFGKPNMERFGAVSQTWYSSLVSASHAQDSEGHRLLASLELRDPDATQSGRAAFPRKLYLEIFLPDSQPTIELNFYWFQKPATRLPEALWLTWNPIVSAPEDPSQTLWTLDKSGQPVSPFDVVPSGGRHMHAVSSGFSYRDPKAAFEVQTIDAPLIALGERSPINFSNSQPSLATGIHSNLFNNAWGTNYLMWFAEDMRFRFVVKCS